MRYCARVCRRRQNIGTLCQSSSAQRLITLYVLHSTLCTVQYVLPSFFLSVSSERSPNKIEELIARSLAAAAAAAHRRMSRQLITA